MTTYLAKQIIGSNAAANPAGALLQSGANRADDSATGDTWIFLNTVNSATNPWGIFHSQVDNKIKIIGDGTDDFWVDMDTGDTYILGNVGIGYDPETSGNTYKLYVNGTVNITSTTTIGDYIYRVYTADDQTPLIWMNGADYDNYLWQIGSGTANGKQYYGYGLKYIGRGIGVANYLQLIADNQNGTDVIAIGVNQSGQIGLGTDANINYRLYVNGSTYFNGDTTHNGNLIFANGGTAFRGINYGTMGDNDQWRIGGAATAANSGYMEIATADDGNEPIYVRQYTGVFSSLTRTLTLLDASGNTNFPGQIYRTGKAVSWFQGRSAAYIKTTSYSGYDAILSMKTTAGDWSLGVYTDNVCYLTYILDSNYNASTNTITRQFYFKPDGTIGGNSFTGNSATATALTSNAGGTEQPIYFTGGKPSATSYALKATVNNSTTGYFAYYSTARAVSGTSNARLTDGCLNLYPSSGSYREGLRIYPTGSWSTIVLGGNDLSATSGTSANSWSIHNNNGNFYISRNASNAGRNLRCVNNVWSVGNKSNNASYAEAAFQIREEGYGGAGTDNWGRAPRLAWHWSGRVAAQIGLASNGYLYEAPVTGTSFYKLVYESGSWDISVTGNANTANYQNCVAGNEIRYARNGNMTSAGNLWQGWAFAEGKVAVINSWQFGNGNGGLAPIYGSKVYNAVWNDFAEYRISDITEGGRVLVSDGKGHLILSTERLQPSARVISDTFGCSVGMSDNAKTPIGVAGRVLVYPYQSRENYKVGDVLCAAPNGTADIMTREEIIQYPDRIIGIVDEIPDYEVWDQVHTNKKDDGEVGEQNHTNIEVKGRIWIYVK